MEGVVTWPQLAFVAGLVVVANASTAVAVAWLVWHVSKIIGEIEKRLLRLEIEMEREPPKRRPP
jgi:hypothetical protein